LVVKAGQEGRRETAFFMGDVDMQTAIFQLSRKNSVPCVGWRTVCSGAEKEN